MSRDVPPAQTRAQYQVIVAALLGLLLVVASPSVNAAYWSPRAAVLLVLLALGLRPFVRCIVDRDPVAVAAGSFVVVGMISAALSPQPALAFVGQYNSGTGALFLLALAATWALGRALDSDGLALATKAAIIGASVNAGVALVQVSTDLAFFPFAAYQDTRASGLLGNPAHLGVLTAAALLFTAATPLLRPVPRLLAIATLAAGLQASGSRGSLALVLLLPLASLLRQRSWRGVTVDVAALAVGLVIALTLATPGTTSSTARLAEASAPGGLTSRLEIWKAASGAVSTRPLLGHGPSRFRSAHLPHRSLEAARAEGPDRLFADAHNLFVEYATTTGLTGLALLIAWLGLGLRQSSTEWRVLSLALLLGHLLQPQMLATTPLMFFASGAGGRRGSRPVADLRDFPQVVLAVACGGVLLVGDFWLNQARLDLDVPAAQQAECLLPVWPVGPAAVAQSYSFESRANRGSSAASQAIWWRQEAVERDGLSPAGWIALGDEQTGDRRFGDARFSYDQALALDQYSVKALNGLILIATQQRDSSNALSLIDRSLTIDDTQPSLRALRQRLLASPAWNPEPRAEAAGPRRARPL
jgi:O-antigen ligase